jgi:hypothetical protein
LQEPRMEWIEMEWNYVFWLFWSYHNRLLVVIIEKCYFLVWNALKDNSLVHLKCCYFFSLECTQTQFLVHLKCCYFLVRSALKNNS